jgi:ribosomal protein S27E
VKDGAAFELFRIDGMQAVRVRCPYCSTTYEFLHSAPHDAVQVVEPDVRHDEPRRRREEEERKLEEEIARLRRKIEERRRQEEEDLALRRAELERRRKLQEEEERRREEELRRRREEDVRRAMEEHRRKEETLRIQREAELRLHAEMEFKRMEQERREEDKKHVHALQKRSVELLQRLQMEEEVLKRTVIQIVSLTEFKFGCPYCGQHLQTSFDKIGHDIPCPSCQQHIHVPEKGMAGSLG